MIRKRGSFSSALEFVSHNTGMSEEKLLNDQKTYRIDGLEEAKDMLVKAMEDRKTIYVFGDYDVDGVCASAIIKVGMTSAGYGKKTIVRLPKRFSEGYGVSEKAVDEFEAGQVLVTVDNGITAMPAIRKAKEKGMQVLVIDHHLPGKATPPSRKLISLLTQKHFRARRISTGTVGLASRTALWEG